MKKTRFLKKSILPLVIMLALTTSHPVYAAKSFAVGSTLAQFKIEVPDSKEDRDYLGVQDSQKEIPFSDLPGKLVILEFFSVYCPICHEQAPVANKLYRFINGDPDLKKDVRMIAIAVGNQPDQVSAYKKKFDTPFPLISDAKGSIMAGVGIESIPQTLILDKNNRILANHVGIITDIDQFLLEVRRFYKEQKTTP